MNINKVARYWKALRVIIPMLLLLVAITPMLNANAQDNVQFGVRPTNQNTPNTSKGYFTLTATPGASIQESITLSNPGTLPVTLMVASVDATTSQRSGPGYLSVEDQRKEVGTWIQFDMNQVTLNPQKQTAIKFTVVVPANVKHGQHLGGIVVQPVSVVQTNAASTPTGSSFGATTVTRNVIAVMVTVGDEKFNPSIKIEGVQIKDVEGAPTLTIALNNDGPILAQPKGDLTITDAAGKVVLNNKLSLESLVPQTSIDYPIFSPFPKTPGTYNVKARLDYGGTAPALYDGTLTIANTAVKTAEVPVSTSPNDPWFNGNVATSTVPVTQQAVGATNGTSSQAAPTSTSTGDSQNLIPIIGVALLLMVGIGTGGYLAGKKGKRR